jgi:hypothetical protein
VPGAQDRWGQLAEPSSPRYERINADLPYGAEQPERGSIADLSRRMERLPPGHPSSPYNDDMTPKPPVTRLKNLELPLHGTEQSSNGAGAAHEPARNGRADASPAPPSETSAPAASATRAPAVSAPRLTSESLPRPASASLPRPASESLPRPASESLPRPASESLPRPASESLPRPASESVPRAAAASSNGATGRNRVASPLGTTERLLTRDLLVTADEPYETDEPEDVTGGLVVDEPDDSAERPDETSGWLSTPTWADTELGLDDAPTGEDGSTSWSTPDWDDTPGWDDAPDTLTHATIDADPGHAANEPLTGPDGSWEWNGRYLTPDESRIADQALGRCRIAEGRNVFGGYGHSGLTPAMRRIEAQLEHGQLLPDTENTALKPAGSFKAKLADLIMRHPDKSAEELALDVHDGIRYAFIFDAEHYTDGTLQAHSRLKGSGFDLEVRRNCWQGAEYKGINCRWRDPAHDLVFEVQFHTAASWDASQRARSLYEAITDAGTPPEERARLRSIYREMSAAVPVPRGCTTIPDYRKEG